MLSGFKRALAGNTHLITLLTTVTALLHEPNSLHNAATITTDFIKLIVTGFNSPSLKALKQALHAELDEMNRHASVFKVDQVHVFPPAEVVVGILKVFFGDEAFADFNRCSDFSFIIHFLAAGFARKGALVFELLLFDLGKLCSGGRGGAMRCGFRDARHHRLDGASV